MGTNHYVKIGKRGLIRAIKGGPYSNVMAQYGLFTPVSGSVYERARQQANYMMEHAGKRNGSRAPLTLHVGKSSCGWRFSLHYIPGLCETLRDWEQIFANALKIVDEYGTEETPNQLIRTITRRGIRYGSTYGGKPQEPSPEFLAENHARWDAENGLLRHDDRITKSSPDGVTYDLIDDDSQSW